MPKKRSRVMRAERKNQNELDAVYSPFEGRRGKKTERSKGRENSRASIEHSRYLFLPVFLP